jgi:hypothetical protein
MNHLSVLDPFFYDNDGDLVRDKNPKGGWLSRAKDARLARGYVLRATCRRRFLGWRSSILELSEREVSDAIGPHAIRIAREEEKDALYTKPVQLPLSHKNLQALDAFVGNDDGMLVRQATDFSKSCSDVTLSRATLLIASMPRSDNNITLTIVVLEENELAALKAAAEKEQEWKKQMDEKARNGATGLSNESNKDINLKLESEPEQISHTNLLFCCFPKKNKAKSKHTGKKDDSGSSQPRTSTTNRLSPAASTVNGTTNANKIPAHVEIGVPSIPPMHRDAVDRTVRQIAQAASSESWDPSWRRIGASDGLTWLLKDGSRMIMVRGTIRAPARSVFEYIWSDDNNNMLSIEPRLCELRTVERDLDGTGHTKTQYRKVSPEWAYACGIEDEEDMIDTAFLRHYHVHPDGTIFIVELGSSTVGGVVIAPVQEDEYSCHVACVETPILSKLVAESSSGSSSTKERLAPWASSRLGAINAKLLGDRLHFLSKYGLSKAPYNDFDAAIRRGQVVNHNGSSGVSVPKSQSSGTSLMKEKMREFDELAVTHSQQSADARQLVESQVKTVIDLVASSIPEERKRYRNAFTTLGDMLTGMLDSPRGGRLRNGAQYPFDCITMWLLTSLPTQESWVEVLVEQIAMRNVEAQTTFGRRVETANDVSNNRISQIMSRDRERPPSL